MSNTNEQKSLEARQKYILAFNDTMIKIGKEQITLLDVIDTRRLLMSPMPLSTSADGRFSEVMLAQSFLKYGMQWSSSTSVCGRKLIQQTLINTT